MLDIENEEFERLVARAVADLPEDICELIENVEVVVAEKASADQLASVGLGRGSDLLGLYEGVPLTHRTSGYGMVLPDMISIFQKPILALCKDRSDLYRRVKGVVWHEIAHHF
ncbi:metallopeptidase family protein, partial [Chloroflexota bacterium]